MIIYLFELQYRPYFKKIEVVVLSSIESDEYKNKKVTIFGLGLNGGGLASAVFFAERGADVTVTDLRTKEELIDSIKKLSGYNINFRLGEHLDSDFTGADIVIKNPAIPSSSRFLKISPKVETDISVFLQNSNKPVLAVTGSKGKSTTVTALHHILRGVYPESRLGGNITVSPLTFVDQLKTVPAPTPVVLELSSWQLADLPNPAVLQPKISVITNIMKDHQNRYESMDQYISDKKIIFQNQTENDLALFPYNDFGKECVKECKCKVVFFSDRQTDDPDVMGYRAGTEIFLRVNGNFISLLKDSFSLPGLHIRSNILIASIVASLYEIPSDIIIERIASFKGVEHRLEFVRSVGSVDYYNDTTATIPDAFAAAVESFDIPTVFIAGGNDKELDFSVLKGVLKKPEGIVLLKGDGTEKIIKILNDEEIPFSGPYSSFDEALKEASDCAKKLEREKVAVVLSPGCTSFGMFMNEFDRGNQFKKYVENLK